MIDISNVSVMGFPPAIRGMRNPMNSWDKSDTVAEDWDVAVGPNDLDLMKRLSANGPVHAKFRRMIVVYLDILAPLYWWKEFDTYKVGTVANSCSTMHKIHAKPFDISDFSHEHLITDEPAQVTWDDQNYMDGYFDALYDLVGVLNTARDKFLETKDKRYWWQMIQLLPSSYNQKRTVMLSYEVLANIYQYRRNHKLDEWVEFCKWIEGLPFSEIIAIEADE